MVEMRKRRLRYDMGAFATPARNLGRGCARPVNGLSVAFWPGREDLRPACEIGTPEEAVLWRLAFFRPCRRDSRPLGNRDHDGATVAAAAIQYILTA